MKKCAYCGRENSDEATQCRECGSFEFVVRSTAPAEPVEPERQSPTSAQESVAQERGQPSDRWQPKTAWLCLLTLVLTAILFGFLFAMATSKTYGTRRFYTPNESGILGMLGGGLTFAITIWFSGVRTMQSFRQNFALIPVSQQQVACAAAAGFLIQAVTIYVFQHGWSHLHLRTSFSYLAVAAVLAPFFEEPLFRGFLYQSFRNKYSVRISIALVVGVALLLHGRRALVSLYGITSIGLINIAASILRERTGSLWPAIVCHLAYNAIPAATEE